MFFVRAWALGCFYSLISTPHSEYRFPAPFVVNQCLEFDQYPNLSEGADSVAGQLRGDKECPFSGITKSGRVWRKVPESDARSVTLTVTTTDR